MRNQKTDERDARLILDLLLAKRFPKIWVPTPAKRDLRQLLWHRHKLVCMRTILGNQLHALVMSQGLCRKKKGCANQLLSDFAVTGALRSRFPSVGVEAH